MLNRDFKEFAESLNSHGVEYLVVGGHALAAHGHPRYTGDIDFWVRPSPGNIAALLRALATFGFGGLGLKASDFTAGQVVQLGFPPRRIDLLSSIDGVDFDACQARRETLLIDGVQLHFIGRDDLIANKRASGRPQDLADLDSLGAP